MSGVGSVLKERYEIIAELGKGGMSTVYLARDKNLGSYWAVKQVKNNGSVEAEAFKGEVELLSTLNHSDVVRIVDRIEIGDDFFVCMDFIDGVSLSKKLVTEGPQSEKEVVEWAKLLCDVLYYLHTVRVNPIVFRDMKPDNIMLTKNGRVKLIDFGIAKECIRGRLEIGPRVGTKGFAAPEQYKGDPLDERTDIYSLGATLHYLVTGRAPAPLPNIIAPIRQINPLLSDGLEYIINRCTQLEPSKRYQNSMELKSDLENIETLNSNYKKDMQKKLFRFCTSVACCIISLVLMTVGNSRIQKAKAVKYQQVFAQGISNEQKKDFTKAVDAYREAIDVDPKNVDAYLKFFNAMLPKNNDPDYIAKTKTAIESLKSYVDNGKNLAVYHNPQLLYQIVKQSLTVNDPKYANDAYSYVINVIQKSSDYKDGKLNKAEVDSYGVIALNKSKNLGEQDFSELVKSLQNLEDYIKSSKSIDPSDKLEDYYTLITIYNSYPKDLTNSYTKIGDLGKAAKALIDENAKSETLSFNKVIPLYECIAASYYSSGMGAITVVDKRTALVNSITWFGYLDDLNDTLSEALELKKGNAYKGIFDSYNSPDEKQNITKDVLDKLNKAKEVYNNLLTKNKSNFLATIKLTEVYLDMEMIKSNPTERDFSKVTAQYKNAVTMKDSTKNLSPQDLTQFSSLKQSMQMVGIKE
jgi:serine/threonine-protein kinase